MIDENETTLKVPFLETTSQAKLEISKTDLSTLEENTNIQIIATLQANQNSQELYKNPKIELVFPQSIEAININSANLLNAEGFEVTTARLQEVEGKKVIILDIKGDQQNYTSATQEGIQIVINANIKVRKDTPTSDSQICMNYINENDLNQDKKQVTKDIKLISKQGMMVYSKVEGYNKAGELQESVDKTNIVAELDMQSDSKIARIERTVINNYETDIENISIIGKLSKEEEQVNENTIKSTYKATLQDLVQTNYENAKISYSQDNGQSWQENVEDLNQVTNFKVDIPEGKLKKGEAIKLTYGINVPEKLEYLDASYEVLQVDYKNEEQEVEDDYYTQFQVTQLKTKENGLNSIALEELNDSFQKIEGIGQVSVKAISGGKELQEGDEVFEGQTIKYEVTIVNDTESVVENVNIIAKHTNSIFLDKKVTKELNTGTGGQMDVTNIVENPELTQKELTIDKIEVGESATCEYEFVIKEDTADQNTSGTIDISVGSAKNTLNTLTNNIKDAKLKLTMRYAYNEEVEVYGNGRFAISLQTKNIGKEDLRDVILQVKVPENAKFNMLSSEFPEQYELIENNDETIKIKLKELQAQQTINIVAYFITNEIPYDELEEVVKSSYLSTIGENTYVSNEIVKIAKQRETKITVSQTGSIERDYVETGDNLIYKAIIKNEGLIDAYGYIKDSIPQGAIIQNAYIMKDNNKIQINDINSNNIEESINLKQGETIEFYVETIIDETKVLSSPLSNIVSIFVGGVEKAKSNEISYVVNGFNVDPDDPDPDNPDPDNPDPDNPDPDNPDPDNPDPDNPDPENISSIMGIAWLDSNKDGQRQGNESTIENMTINLLDAKTGEEKQTTKTNSQGKYTFDKLKDGEYIVIFNYDTNKYELTQYHKEGVEEYLNSDVVEKQINGKQVAITDTINVNKNEYTADAGFVEGKIFDLKLDKYVKSVTVQNSAGTKVVNYDKAKLAKVELDAKRLAGTAVFVEYEITVTNEGELPGYINDIADYLPNDMAFDNVANKTWTLSKDNVLHNASLTNEIINSGETKTVNLTLSIPISENTGGSITNIAEINEATNSKLVADTDSIGGNQKQGEDDISSAEVLISIKTGIGFVISIGIVIAMCVIIGIIIYRKRKEGKNIEL